METFPLPKKVEVKKIGENKVQFIFEPLYPGYGTTIGNALRRALLSSLPGSAVQTVKIKGVDHEFSTIPHVKEDVVTIILNLKQLRFKFHEKEPVKITLKAKGEKEITAADIKPSSGVEVINKKQTIATLTDKGASLEMEITVGPGRGYIPVEAREKELLEIGAIAVDAIYTPIRNVNFEKENVRVEQMTNYDRLILDITTDGTITPEKALKMSSDTLVDHFNFVKELKSAVEEKKEPEIKVKESKELKEEPKEEKKEEDKALSEEKEKAPKKKRGRPKKS